METKELLEIEVWLQWTQHGVEGLYIPTEEIQTFIMPQLDKVAYFEINKEMLSDMFDLVEDEMEIGDIDWEYYNDIRYASLSDELIELEDYTDEFCTEKGFLPYDESDSELYYAYSYYDAQTNLKYIWKDENEIVKEFTISEDYVSLDEWDAERSILYTRAVHTHESVHRIYENNEPTDRFIIVQHSQWQGVQPVVIDADISLTDVMDYIESLEDIDGMYRNECTYKDELEEIE